MSTYKAKISFRIKRFKNFMGIFKRSKKGILGVAILMFFITIAVAAPLITPYDPVYVPSHPRNPPIAYRWAKPIWYKYLPFAEELSENVEPMQDPHFNTATSIEELELTTRLTGHSLSLQFISDIGSEEEEKEKNGCVAIVFNREEDENPLGEVTANLTKVFYYPYKAPPNRFVGQVAMLVNASEDVSVTINVVIEKEGGERRLEWWRKTFTSNGTTWITPSPLIDSSGEIQWWEQKFGPEWKINPAQTMFSEQGNYRYGLEMMFNDTRRSKGEKVEATIYIDDFYIRLLGNSFGLLGSDQVGRDVFTQLVYGARISLIIGLLSAFFSTAIGLIIGLTAGYIGKFVDQILMRFTDLLLVIPDVPLFIVLMSVLSASVWNLILLIAVIGWTGFARVVRSQTLSLRERPFIEAAKAVGASRFRIITRHIMPNVMNLVYVTLALSVPYAILSESWLSWLGLYDPKLMTWGRMLRHAEETAQGYKLWWWTLPP
ncbi:MAG: ABC transporter permease, partial [Desulfobacterales bacterium]|nr:ABC transporter permease [Desulfobacterales bacterium]